MTLGDVNRSKNGKRKELRVIRVPDRQQGLGLEILRKFEQYFRQSRKNPFESDTSPETVLYRFNSLSDVEAFTDILDHHEVRYTKHPVWEFNPLLMEGISRYRTLL